MVQVMHYRDTDGPDHFIPDFYYCSSYGDITPHDDRMTKNAKQVTCKRCLRRMNNIRVLIKQVLAHETTILPIDFFEAKREFLSEIPIHARNTFLSGQDQTGITYTYWNPLFPMFWCNVVGIGEWNYENQEIASFVKDQSSEGKTQ